MAETVSKYREDFEALVNRAMETRGFLHMRPVIEKELLHYDLLFVLEKNGLLDKLTFQGGTALRLCYGAERLSEDLDFVGGRDFSASDLTDMKSCVEDYIGGRYGLIVSVKHPTEMAREPEGRDVRVDRWRISIITSPKRKDLPMQKIKIDICNVQAYTRLPLAIKVNYDFLPDGYEDTLIMTESLDEIMADKIVSLVNTTKYVRYRDFWDLRWLKRQGARVNPEFIAAKIEDYKITDYKEKLDNRINDTEAIIKGKGFSDEMSRFISMQTQERTLEKQKFKDFLAMEIKTLLLGVRESLSD